MYNLRKFFSFILVFALVVSQSIPVSAASDSTGQPVLFPETSMIDTEFSFENSSEESVPTDEFPSEEVVSINAEDSPSEETEDPFVETTILDNIPNISSSDDNTVTEEDSGSSVPYDDSGGAILHPQLYNLGNNYSMEEVSQLYGNSIRYQLVTFALRYLGNPYVWGGTSLTNGADCSGFTQSIYNYFQINIPRTAANQYDSSVHIRQKDLKPGDLVFYSNSMGTVNHVAIYIGNQQVIHASASDVGIIVSNMNYRKAYGYGTFIGSGTDLGEQEELLQRNSGFYISNVVGNYYNGVRASAYTIGYESNNNVGMGICCDHSASTASLQSALTQANDPSELVEYGLSEETQFYLAILCSLAPYAHEGSLDNGYFNWQDFGCSTPSQANALCSLACSYLCGRSYGGVSQAVRLGNWITQYGHVYWDFWGYIQNAALSDTTQNDITKIVSRNGEHYYMSRPIQLTGNRSGSTFKVISTSESMQAVISDTDSTLIISDVFEKKSSSPALQYYSDAKDAVIDQNQYITLFYPVSSRTIGKTVTARVVPTKAGAVYRLNYYFPAGNYQPVVMCDGITTNKEFLLSFSSAPMHEMIIKKRSQRNSITENNPNYSLEGATYNIYKENGAIAYYFTSSEGDFAKAENLKTDANGNIIVKYDNKETTNIHVLPDIYYVKETKASPGYQLDSCANKTSKGHIADVKTKSFASITCLEPPVSDSISVCIYKKDKEELSNQSDLSGAVFKVCYYNRIFKKYTDIAGAPTRTWFIETKKNSADNYVAKLDQYHLSSRYNNSEFYRNSQGNITLPLGTVTITEIKPPANYYNINFHGRYYDGVNHIYDVTNMRQSTFYGTIRPNSSVNTGAALYIGSSMNQTTNTPVYGNLSITYSDCIMPTLKTRAFVEETGCNTASSIYENTCYDLVTMKGLSKGQTYTITSQIVNKETGEVIKDRDGNDCIHTRQFCASASEETCKVFVGKLSGKDYIGTQLVIQEYLKWNDTIIARETDLNNSEQTIVFPEIHTQARADGNTSYAGSVETIHIKDTVTYQGLIPGKTYTIRGKVMCIHGTGSASPLSDREGNPCIAAKTFIPEQEQGTVDIEFILDPSQYAVEGLTAVIFEDLYINDFKLATHSELTDKNQTIYFPNANTSLTADDTEMQNIAMGGHIDLTDTVSYTNLEIGSEHVIKGMLVNKETGKPIQDTQGNVVTSEAAFIPEGEHGTVLVHYSFDVKDTQLAQTGPGAQAIVCFENIYRLRDNRHIIQHEDINDVDQTVYIPGIQTTAWEQSSKSNTAEPINNITIIDTLAYSGLIKGETYTVKGRIMLGEDDSNTNVLNYVSTNTDREFNRKEEGYTVTTDQNGIPCYLLTNNGKPVTGEATFIAEDTNGTVDITYTFDASDLNGKSTVIFEDLYYKNYKIATHSDMNAKEQTIQFTPHKTEISIRGEHQIEGGGSSGSGSVKTGENPWILLFLIISLLLVVILYLATRKYKSMSVSEKPKEKYLSQKIKKGLLISSLMLAGVISVSHSDIYAATLNKNPAISSETAAKSQITKSYSNLKEKNKEKLKDTIKENGITYALKSVIWEEIPIHETVEYTINYGMCTKEPDYSQTYSYSYTSPTTKETNTVTLPFVRLEKGTSAWIDGFSAIATFKNIENGTFTLGEHTFEYGEDMDLTPEDYIELIHLLGYDTSLYRLHSYQWRGNIYTGEDQGLWRDATLYGQQYATEYSAYYADSIEVGCQYNAIATYEEIEKEPAGDISENADKITAPDSIIKQKVQTKTDAVINQKKESINDETQISIQNNKNDSTQNNQVIRQVTKKSKYKLIIDSICVFIIVISLTGLYQISKKNKSFTQTKNET